MDYQILEKIKDASRFKNILRIVYIEKDGNSDGWRYVEPYSFRGDGEQEALFAWDIQKDGMRRFTLNRIDRVELTDQTFAPRYLIEIR